MTPERGTWPRIPPEVPPPHRPDVPDEPEHPSPAPPPVPVVPGSSRTSERPDLPDLLRHRTVLVHGALDEAAATEAAAKVMTLDAEGDDEIVLRLSCDEADLLSALMLAETIHLASSSVVATATGVVAGAALAVLAAADRRLTSPHATLRLSEPLGSVAGTASEITADAEELLRQVDRLHAWIASASGRPQDDVAEDARRGRILDAAAAVEYGLVDEIVTSPARRGRSGGV